MAINIVLTSKVVQDVHTYMCICNVSLYLKNEGSPLLFKMHLMHMEKKPGDEATYIYIQHMHTAVMLFNICGDSVVCVGKHVHVCFAL